MNEFVQAGSGIVFMKVGTHAQESLEDIIARKQREIDEAGISLWGYGGSTCHPTTTVQPFAKAFVRKSGAIYLCMEEMESRHFAEPKRADQYSADGLEWADVPQPINVLGSRYALVLEELRITKFDLSLARTRVAIGNQQGKLGSAYISGRVDKACLVVESIPPFDGEPTPSSKRIGLVAKLKSPYAVFLRNRP